MAKVMTDRISENKKTNTTFRFKNIGPVHKADLKLGDLTVIAGRNNTGKTYITYTLYGFLKTLKSWSHIESLAARRNPSKDQFPDIPKLARKISQEGMGTFALNTETLIRQQKEIIREFSRTFSKKALPSVFNSQEDHFQKSSIDVDIAQAPSDYCQSMESDPDQKGPVSIKYDGSEITITYNRPRTELSIARLQSLISYSYSRFLFHEAFPAPFILSAERFGISLFYRELDFTKNQLVDILQKMGDDKRGRNKKISPFMLIDKAASRYARPIKDNIDYTRSIPDLSRRESDLYQSKLFDHIKNMMDGYYRTSGEDIRFISKSRKEQRFNIPLHVASSSVRGFSDLYFFLRHKAEKNTLLILDEPESHLDTHNQRLLARLLASMVRVGLKVLITTHSDYLIKEINNLVMLSNQFTGRNNLAKKFKYGENEFLTPDSVRAYVAENNGLTPCHVDDFGIDMPVFDETIDDINRTSNELASSLSEDSGA